MRSVGDGLPASDLYDRIKAELECPPQVLLDEKQDVRAMDWSKGGGGQLACSGPEATRQVSCPQISADWASSTT